MKRITVWALTVAIICTLSPHVFGQSRDKYPSHWWAEVPRDDAPDWEILPQDAGPGEVILSKRNELGLLSNFASTPILVDGISYPSLEGFWQMMKYPEGVKDERSTFPGLKWPFNRSEVSQMTGFDAKKAGSAASKNMKVMDINWVTYNGNRMTYRTLDKGDHYRLIKRAMWAKLQQNENVRDVLLRTGDLILKPDHKQGDGTPHAWKYYEIWMEFRDVIKEESASF